MNGQKRLLEQPLISVVVPIYNVEKYVRKCLDSLQNQTMKQIEVICINDGSTDASGEIAEEYIRDERFRVFHTENRGLSAARNRGIDEAKAEWIMFVDSDDWVDERFCEIPYRAAQENNADMVIFEWCAVKRERKVHKIDAPKGIINEFTALERGEGLVWNKLYSRNLFKGIQYPVGRIYEDLATTHKLVHNANRIYLLHHCLYYHAIRKYSISHTRTLDNKRSLFISAYERYEDLISYGYPEEKHIDTICPAAIGLLSLSKPSDDELYLKARKIIDSVNGIPKTFSRKQKIALIVWRMNKRLFYLLSRCAALNSRRSTNP